MSVPARGRSSEFERLRSRRILFGMAVMGGLFLAAASAAAPVLRAIRMGAEWIDNDPRAPVVLACLAAIAAVTLFRSRRVWVRPKRRGVVVHIARFRTELWEGQRIIRQRDTQTAQIRFVLHSRKKAG